MIANALILTIAILLTLGFWLMGELKFLIPYKGLLLHQYTNRDSGLYRCAVSQLVRSALCRQPTLFPQRHRPKTLPSRQTVARWRWRTARAFA